MAVKAGATRVRIAPLAAADCAEFIAAVAASRRLHGAWVSAPQSTDAFLARVRRMQAPVDYAFSIRLKDGNALVGLRRRHNLASIALARACGFSKEGYSPRYLKIRGRWRDHERWALLAR